MQLKQGHHLGYCTNIHRGESWEETFGALKRWTLPVRDQVASGKSYAIGLRLSDLASRELSVPGRLNEFKNWLRSENCYVCSINGFPFGQFHGGRVKEQVYRPDWTTPERLDYTLRLFDILGEILPPGVEGSVSTVPGSFKRFIHTADQVRLMEDNLWRVADHLAAMEKKSGVSMHLGLEPEPLCFLETTGETIEFFQSFWKRRPGDTWVRRYIGVNYDTCHLAVEFETAGQSLSALSNAGIRLSKIHLSSALKVRMDSTTSEKLTRFAEETYLHQVVARRGRTLHRYEDLPLALKETTRFEKNEEWRIHFHVPLHAEAGKPFETTVDHLLETLDFLQANPGLCLHLEMETYTWEVLPEDLKSRDVVSQLAAEYRWCLKELDRRGLA